MAKVGDPCPRCGMAEPRVKFTPVTDINKKGKKRGRPARYRPQECDTCRNGTKNTERRTLALLMPFIGGAIGGALGARTGRRRP
jgi:hypothetical protein